MSGRRNRPGKLEGRISSSIVRPTARLPNFSRLLTLSSPTDDSDAVRRKYKKDLDHLKLDLEAYNRQKETALGLAAGTLSKTGEGSSAVVPTSQEQRLASENLYRNANTLIYGDNKPSEEAIDKVVSKINQE